MHEHSEFRMSSLQSTLRHLLCNVLSAAEDYAEAERRLSKAFSQDQTPSHWKRAADDAKRRASDLAVAIDGLADRAKNDTGIPIDSIRQQVGALCVWPGTMIARIDALDRVRGVANAYKHQILSDKKLPITSERDVFALGVGYGQDAFGVGKFGGVEVFVVDKNGKSWKFLGDAPVAIAAWFQFLKVQGVSLLSVPIFALGVKVFEP